MQKNNFRLINSEETKQVNSAIAKKFGNKNRIASGTCEYLPRNKKRYHIVLEDHAYKSIYMLTRIAKLVKEALGAESVYYFGTKLA